MGSKHVFLVVLSIVFGGLAFAFDPVDPSKVNMSIRTGSATSEGFAALDGLHTESLKFTLSGYVSDLVVESQASEDFTMEQLRVLVNEVAYRVEVDSDGYFENTYPINPGENHVALQVLDDDWEAYTTDSIAITVAPMRLDLRVEITWDQVDGTDIDLHMFREDKGNSVPEAYDDWAGIGLPHVGWMNDHPTDFSANAAANPYLDIKVPSGYGPETIVLHELEDTNYHLLLHAYSLPSDGRPVTVEVLVYVGGYTYIFEHVFTEPWSAEYIWSIEGESGLVVSVLPNYLITW